MPTDSRISAGSTARAVSETDMHHDERIHPAAMRCSHGQVAATCRHVLLTGGRDPEAEDDEAEDPDEQADRAV